MRSIIISASILSANFRHLENEIRHAEDAGVDWIHIDVMDGHFVPNISMGPFIVAFCREITNLPIDVHLMIEKPENHINAFSSAGANFLTIHPEGNPNILRTLMEIQSLGCKTGLALNPGTPTSLITSLLDYLDLILVLTVNPGFSGQSYIPTMTKKIIQAKGLVNESNLNTLIQVDGGISSANIKEVVTHGADIVVSASSIFRHPGGIDAGVKALRNAVL